MNIKGKLLTVLKYIAVFAVCFVLALPMISMFGTSLKTKTGAMSDVSLLPSLENVYFGNFGRVLGMESYLKSVWNSALVSIISTAICVTIAAMASYAISRFKGRIFTGFIALLLVLQMLPSMLTLLPMFRIYKGLGLNNTHGGLVIAYVAFSLTFSIWLMKGFFDSIPKDLDEAAMIDGCTRFQTFLRVVLPVSKPGLATVAIFTFIRSWNEYMMARILIQSDGLKTINLALQKFVQENLIDWSLLSAGAVIATLPTLVFLLFAQKQLVQGLTSGAVKG